MTRSLRPVTAMHRVEALNVSGPMVAITDASVLRAGSEYGTRSACPPEPESQTLLCQLGAGGHREVTAVRSVKGAR